MTRSPLSKVVLASVLTLVLAVPALPAAQRRAPSAPRARVSSSAGEAFLRLWNSMTGFLKEGCTIDPSGRCVPRVVAPASLDAGCTIDPDGRCISGR
jgi:hypothetical protein